MPTGTTETTDTVSSMPKQVKRSDEDKESSSQNQVREINGREKETPDDAPTAPTICEGQEQETLIQAKPNLSLGMKPLITFFEIQPKGG